MTQLHDFHGGIHPPEFKSLSNQTPISYAPLPKCLYVPLTQSVGSPSIACVAVGDKVLKGQMIARAGGHISVALHAPSSGTIAAIKPHPLAHPSALNDLTIVIDCDGKDEWLERQPLNNWQNCPRAQVCDYLRDMGIVGLGGAIFPSHLKAVSQKLDTLIINGAECEPFITCDDRLMRERSNQLVSGIKILAHLLSPKRVAIGVEDNKSEAIAALRQACADTNFEVVSIPTKYPSGGAKQLIYLLTGKEIPHGVRSTDFGVQCFNVATAYSIHRAINHGEALISRIVTITGAVAHPQNVEALIGTPINELMRCADEIEYEQVIMGGPLMGFVLPNLYSGVHKATNCLIAKSDKFLPKRPDSRACIRCGECAKVCPARLQPMDLYWFAKARQFGKAQEWHLFDCIECGSCSYVCPSQIPLVDFYLYAKSEIWAAEREKKSADHARKRHEFRLERQEREQAEKSQRLAAKALLTQSLVAAKDSAAISSVSVGENDAKRAAIHAAMARAADKKALSGQTVAAATSELPKPATPDIDQQKRAVIQAAVQRAAAKKAERIAAEKSSLAQANPTSADIDEQKRMEIQAAMQRAAAKTIELSAVAAPSSEIDEEKRAAIKASMARAAAKKAEREAVKNKDKS